MSRLSPPVPAPKALNEAEVWEVIRRTVGDQFHIDRERMTPESRMYDIGK